MCNSKELDLAARETHHSVQGNQTQLAAPTLTHYNAT